jgi:pimeloyl-ACP methyl ester carboxylesterase
MLRHPLRVIRAVLLLNGHHLVHTPAIVREACFREDIPAERLARYAALLGSESLRVGLETGLFHFPRPAYNRSPLKVIAAEHDKIFTLQEQQALANAYHTDLFVIPGAAHDVMLEPAWKHAADYIEQTVADWTGDL